MRQARRSGARWASGRKRPPAALLTPLPGLLWRPLHCAAGGGSRNPLWTAIRQQQLGVPVVRSEQAEAAYGAARLARQGAELASPSPTALLM